MLVKNKMVKNLSYDKTVVTTVDKIVGKKEAPYTIGITANNFLIPYRVLILDGASYREADRSELNGEYHVTYSGNQINIILDIEGEFKVIYGTNSNQI